MKTRTTLTALIIIIISIFSYYWVQTDQMMRETDKQYIQ